ncbi:Flp family type IVb pilin [Maritalea mediterranea]|uniref:Flp family type IVb pilin n=1 Tax=Maritalea mediterranea TaxID=2909667 RepID=A0ABS9EDJ1_9HYPH|nr:Flp family type IVb pilin [Maritalea mediterranea]MCF4099496.1 Flp family type IVb pilin [Maritalea mediterranea]
MDTIKEFLTDESGATAIEYALIGSLVSVAIILGVSALSGNLEAVFNAVATAFSDAMSG